MQSPCALVFLMLLVITNLYALRPQNSPQRYFKEWKATSVVCKSGLLVTWGHGMNHSNMLHGSCCIYWYFWWPLIHSSWCHGVTWCRPWGSTRMWTQGQGIWGPVTLHNCNMAISLKLDHKQVQMWLVATVNLKSVFMAKCKPLTFIKHSIQMCGKIKQWEAPILPRKMGFTHSYVSLWTITCIIVIVNDCFLIIVCLLQFRVEVFASFQGSPQYHSLWVDSCVLLCPDQELSLRMVKGLQ